ncbi:MAG TPA: hypothetical protein VGP47_05425 [Parachlamydiaceae bacterium]|nr:hypothetical protein [Parachlamydiaceae bacterium]
MDPIAFPPQIRNYFTQNTDEKNDDDQLTKLFKENKSVKENFIAWAHQHESSVYNIPRLHHTLDIATASDSIDSEDIEWHGIANTINKIFHFFKNNISSNTFLSVIMNPEEFKSDYDMYELITDYHKEYFDTVMHLSEAGIIDKEQQMNALLIKNPMNDRFVIADTNILKEVFPSLHTMDHNDLVDLILTKNLNGKTTFDLISDFRSLQDPEIFLFLVSILVEKDKLPADADLDLTIGRNFLKLYNKDLLSSDEIIDFLSLRLSNGTLLSVVHDNIVIAPFLKKLDPQVYLNLLALEKDSGRSVLRISTMHILEKHTSEGLLELKDLISVLTNKNNKGETVLHYQETINGIYFFLENLPQQNLNQLFSIQDNAGNTPLHKTENASALLDKNQPAHKIRNDSGFTAQEWYQIGLSSKWLVKDKLARDSNTLTEKEYGEKVTALKETLNSLWNSFVFGDEEGNIPSEYLRLIISDIDQTYTPTEIKNALDVMLDKIIKKTPWLGTPRTEDAEGLHQFYSQMLNNLDEVSSRLSEKDPSEQAGTLIGIAKVELENRCAAAYQSEIEQAKMLLDFVEEGLGLEANFEKMTRTSLLGTIENIVRRDFNGDSHVFSQMLYSVGMAPSADPLFLLDAHYLKVDVQDCQAKIMAEWTRAKVLSDLTGSIGRIDNDQLQDWFKSSTPEDFGQEFRLNQTEVQHAEQVIVNETKRVLTHRGFKTPLSENALEIFQSTQGMALIIGTIPRKHVSMGVFEKLNQASTAEEIHDAQDLFIKENEMVRFRKIELLEKEDVLREKPIESLSADEKNMLEALIEERKNLQVKSMGITSEFNALKRSAEAKIKIEELFKMQNIPVSKNELNIIIEEKKIFDSKIRDLAEESDVDFNPSETGLPSKGLEYQRRAAYASEFFSEKDNVIKLNARGAFNIAQHIGVLESVA